MKICFIGVGSIASRHIKNIFSLYKESVKIDVLRSGNGKPLQEDINKIVSNTYFSYDELPFGYDVIFITNPTKLHYETLKKTKNHAKHFFIEKPVFEYYTEDIHALDLNKEAVYYVACPLRYTNVIQYLKNNIDFDKVFSLRCISSSYLPDWRQGIDYRYTYSAKKEMGGGVSIDLIHEWDYIYYLIGEPRKVYSLISKKSDLEITSDDLAIYIADYRDKMVEIHLDYFGRKTIRKIELFMKDDTIEADLINQKITYMRSKKIIDLAECRDSYQQKELIHFFDIVNGEILNDNTIEEACRVLRLAKGKK